MYFVVSGHDLEQILILWGLWTVSCSGETAAAGWVRSVPLVWATLNNECVSIFLIIYLVSDHTTLAKLGPAAAVVCFIRTEMFSGFKMFPEIQYCF